MHAKFWWGNLKERGHLEGLSIDGKDNIKMDPKEVGWVGMCWVHWAEDRALL
jgi:hypothetical protein